MTNIADTIKTVVMTQSGANDIFAAKLNKHVLKHHLLVAANSRDAAEQAFLLKAAGADALVTVNELLTCLKSVQQKMSKTERADLDTLVFELEDLILQGKGARIAAEIFVDNFGDRVVAYKHNLDRPLLPAN